MSATGRRDDRRREADFYPTPGWCTRAILPHLDLGGFVLEPAAGKGAIVRELLDAGVPAGRIRAVEIDPGRAAACGGLGVHVEPDDFLEGVGPMGVDLVITNPPYGIAQGFVERSLSVVRPGGTVAMLLRLAFLEGQERASFHRRHPSSVLVLPRRPSFTGAGTDSSAYAWFVWGPERGGRWAVLDVDDRRQASLFSAGAP